MSEKNEQSVKLENELKKTLDKYDNSILVSEQIKDLSLIKKILAVGEKGDKQKFVKKCINDIYIYADNYHHENNNILWRNLRSFLYRIQAETYVTEDFFVEIARLNPVEFVIYLLSPFINSIASNGGEFKPDEKSIVYESVKMASESCKSELDKIYFIDEVEHLVAHHALRKLKDATPHIGKNISELILKGLTDALRERKNDGFDPALKQEDINFDDISKVRQSYWNRQKPISCINHKTHTTIRINSVPFAEGALIYMLAYYAHEYAINLEIVDTAWKDVGAALLTGKIDVAIYNEKITDQFSRHHKLIRSRLFYRTQKVFTYKGYFLLGSTGSDFKAVVKKKEFTEKNRVAVVLNSDSENIFKIYCDTTLGRDVYEKLVMPAKSPDSAIKSVVNGECNFCIAGGIHTEYVNQHFKDIIGTQINKDEFDTEVEVFFWSVSSKKQQSEKILRDIASLWGEVHDGWFSVKKGIEDEDLSLREGCVAHVNRQPNQAFVTEKEHDDDTIVCPFDVLSKLIDDHNVLHDLSHKIDNFELEQRADNESKNR